MFTFHVVNNGQIFQSREVYLDYEHSFSYEPSVQSDLTFVVGPYIQLHFDSGDMTARQISGLSPHYSWQLQALNVPAYDKGRLILEQQVEGGTGAYGIQETEEWISRFDVESGWFCIGGCQSSPGDQAVEFAIHTVAVVDKNRYLKALWWKPVFREGFDIRAALSEGRGAK